MNTVLVIVIIGLVVMVVVSLIRGIIAFMQSAKEDMQTPGSGATPLQVKQNQMMFNRIKYQALAILVVGVLILLNR